MSFRVPFPILILKFQSHRSINQCLRFLYENRQVSVILELHFSGLVQDSNDIKDITVANITLPVVYVHIFVCFIKYLLLEKERDGRKPKHMNKETSSVYFMVK